MSYQIHQITNAQGEKLDFTYHATSTHHDHLIILGHGVTGDKDDNLLTAIATALSGHGWPCLRLSFSGNGKSEGTFTDSNITKETADLSAVIDQIGTGKKIAYIGHSMGGAVGALTVARDDRINAIITLAGMVHTRAFIEREFKTLLHPHKTFQNSPTNSNFIGNDPAFPLSSNFLNDLHHIDSITHAVAELRIPWLLIHGLDDTAIPPSDSRDLAEHLRGPHQLEEIPEASHSFENHYTEVNGFIQTWLTSFF